MDLEQLNRIDTSNPEQVKALQTFLKTRGYYNGAIDGKWGGGTTEGSVKHRNDLTAAQNNNVTISNNNRIANDPTNNAIRGATEIAPYAVGIGLGAWAGRGAAGILKDKNTAAMSDIAQIAANPKISGVEGARAITQARDARNNRAGLQFLAPAAMFASAQAMRRYVAPMMGPTPEDQKWVNLGANADQGAGVGMTVHQLMDLKNQVGPVGNLPDEALIRTRAAAENAPPPPPDVRPNSERLTAAAKAAGATGKMTKAEAADYVANNVTDANRAAVLAELPAGTPGRQLIATVKRLAAKPGASTIIAPLIGAGVAYDAASNDAEAAGATPGQARTEGAKAGALAGAGTAGVGYGVNKLLEHAPNIARALGIGGEMTMPLTAMNMGPDTPEAANLERARLAQEHPLVARMLGLRDEMGQQLPERNMGKTPELANAAALQIPEGIPLPRRDGQSPYPDMRGPMPPQPGQPSRALINAMLRGAGR